MRWTEEELAAMAEADAEIERTFELTVSEIKESNQRDCTKERSKNAIAAAKWYAKNRDSILEKRRKYYQEHRDEILAKSRERYKKNREAKRQYCRARYRAKKEAKRAE